MNAIVIYLNDNRYNNNDVLNIMKKYFKHAYGMNYLFKKQLLEVGFITQEEQIAAENTEIIYNNKKLQIQKLHHIADIFTVIRATNINIQPKIKDTKQIIKDKLEKYGVIKEIFIPLIENILQKKSLQKNIYKLCS